MLTQNLPESFCINHVPPPPLPRPFQYRVTVDECETKKNGRSAKRSLGYITHVQPLRGMVRQSV